ncbi:hypothetical protein EDC02_1706 [Micromonospora sp. Llam0]|uniref:hypothetical protein n=1 Tax=Micromonospora sp. Llam0 TaxID=2485143 RepID=UPI000F49846B|nr:hypothetical protein [Micromonospora sp. Llam0]ROO59862.1 hypothetical protein EDC02_1706 [Micromonospora sp. Llam0]
MTSTRTSGLGLPAAAIVGLALLAVPRAVLHDLGLVHERTFVNLVLVVLPVAVWILVAVTARVPNPFLTLLVVGVVYGILLALTHQLLWHIAWADDLPALGGNLAGRLSPAAESVVLRTAAALSSLFTGTLVGAFAGLISWLLSVATRARS